MRRLARAAAPLSLDEVSAVNTTNERHILGMRLTVATALVAGGTFVVSVVQGGERGTMALNILDSWLFFLAAYLGINTAQFAVKRFSDKGLAEVKAGATPPQQVVSAPGGTVVAQQPLVAERAVHGMDNSRTDDERGDDAPG